MATHTKIRRRVDLEGYVSGDDSARRAEAKFGSDQLRDAMLRYGLKNGGVLSISAAQRKARLGGRG